MDVENSFRWEYLRIGFKPIFFFFKPRDKKLGRRQI